MKKSRIKKEKCLNVLIYENIIILHNHHYFTKDNRRPHVGEKKATEIYSILIQVQENHKPTIVSALPSHCERSSGIKSLQLKSRTNSKVQDAEGFFRLALFADFFES